MRAHFSSPFRVIALAGLVLLLAACDGAIWNNPYPAAESGHIDRVIFPHETRAHVIRALRALRNKRGQLPPKKHGNIPL